MFLDGLGKHESPGKYYAQVDMHPFDRAWKAETLMGDTKQLDVASLFRRILQNDHNYHFRPLLMIF